MRFRRLIFEGGYHPIDEHETPWRGYRSNVAVEMGDGTRYPITFYDPVRLKQTLDDEVSSGSPFFTEPGLVVIPVVNLENMQRAAGTLCEQGFFSHMKPLQ